MKKKAIKRELKRVQREQLKLWEHIAEAQLALLRLLEEGYEPDDDDGDEVDPGVGYEILAGKAPRLKVVGE